MVRKYTVDCRNLLDVFPRAKLARITSVGALDAQVRRESELDLRPTGQFKAKSFLVLFCSSCCSSFCSTSLYKTCSRKVRPFNTYHASTVLNCRCYFIFIFNIIIILLLWCLTATEATNCVLETGNGWGGGRGWGEGCLWIARPRAPTRKDP